MLLQWILSCVLASRAFVLIWTTFWVGCEMELLRLQLV